MKIVRLYKNGKLQAEWTLHDRANLHQDRLHGYPELTLEVLYEPGPEELPQCDFTFRSGKADVHCIKKQHEGDTHLCHVVSHDLVETFITHPDVQAALPRIIKNLKHQDGESWAVGEALERFTLGFG